MIARLLGGQERGDTFARNYDPEVSRFSQFWELFKGKFGKMLLLNLFMLLTFAPVVALFILHALALTQQGATGPYGSGLGVGYPVIPDVTGAAEMAALNSDLLFYALLIPAGAIASVGIAGGMYALRNMLWTGGAFSFKDLGYGIRRNYWQVLEASLLFIVVLFFAMWVGDLANLYRALNSPNLWLMITAQVFVCILLVLVLFVALWMVALSMNYKHNAWTLLRNGVVMTFGTFPQTVFIAACALWPFALVVFDAGFMTSVGVVLLILFAFSYAMLAWMCFAQWGFDKFLGAPTAVKAAEAPQPHSSAKQKKQERLDSASEQIAAAAEAERLERRAVLSYGRSQLMSRPISPVDEGEALYELPQTFTREDLARLRGSRSEMAAGVAAYESAHEKEARYVDYNRRYEALSRSVSGTEGDGKKKKGKRRPKRPGMLK